MKSRYPTAALAIRQWISQQQLPAGASLPSIRFLAEQIGFKTSTTERAANLLIARDLLWRKGYKLIVGTENTERSPIEGVCYVLSYVDEFTNATGRILSYLRVKHRLVNLSWARHSSPLPTLRKVLKEKPAGVILWSGSLVEDLAAALKKETTPIVICTDIPIEVDQSLIQLDLYRAAEKAVNHLVDLGHQNIAHVSCSLSDPREIELAACFRTACLKANLRHSASEIWQAENDSEEALQKTMLEQHKRHPKVTAIFATGTAVSVAEKIFKIPTEISAISVYDNPTIEKTRTMVTLREPEEYTALLACTEIIYQIQAVESGRPRKPPRRVLLVPDLIVRRSTRALVKREKVKAIADDKSRREEDLKTANPWESWRKTYTSLIQNHLKDWRQLDLTKLANHSISKQHGWLGEEPLLHFLPGLRSIHGVPFQVIDENHNSGCAVVTFRSPHTHSTAGKKLPVFAKLPLGYPVRALYFLHGCAYARPVPFAEYNMHYKTGNKTKVSLIPLGTQAQLTDRATGKSNLQDWWQQYAQRDFPHAFHVTVFNPADPQEYTRTLYSLEWINPRPGRELSHIEVRVDPVAGPTLALIAVTVLL